MFGFVTLVRASFLLSLHCMLLSDSDLQLTVVTLTNKSVFKSVSITHCALRFLSRNENVSYL